MGDEEGDADLLKMPSSATPQGPRKRRKRRGLGSASSQASAMLSSPKLAKAWQDTLRDAQGQVGLNHGKGNHEKGDAQGLTKIQECGFVCGLDSGSPDPVSVAKHPEVTPDELPRVRWGRTGGTDPDRYDHAVGKGVRACWYCERAFSIKHFHKVKDRKSYQLSLASDKKAKDAFMSNRSQVIQNKIGGKKKLVMNRKVLKRKVVWVD